MQEKELVQETEWMRVYRSGPKTFFFQSKFVSESLEIGSASLKERWFSFTPMEQLEFANAFILKPHLTAEDQEILKFLMEKGSEYVWGTIAYLLPQYSDREGALSFLLERIASGGRCVSNYYQALEQVGDVRAIPLLRQRYEDYQMRVPPFEQHGPFSELSDYQVCCRTLWKLTGSPEYQDALKELLHHSEETIRRRAHFLLFDQWP